MLCGRGRQISIIYQSLLLRNDKSNQDLILKSSCYLLLFLFYNCDQFWLYHKVWLNMDTITTSRRSVNKTMRDSHWRDSSGRVKKRKRTGLIARWKTRPKPPSVFALPILSICLLFRTILSIERLEHASNSIDNIHFPET